MIKRKGIQHLIDALPGVVEKFPNAICIIAGTGPDEELFKSKVKNNEIEKFVKFIGLLDDEGLSMAYRAADLFILPSLGEGQPTCILEAMANSCPVVATRIEGVLDYYEDFAVFRDRRSQSLSEKLNIRFRKSRKIQLRRRTWKKVGGQNH